MITRLHQRAIIRNSIEPIVVPGWSLILVLAVLAGGLLVVAWGML